MSISEFYDSEESAIHALMDLCNEAIPVFSAYANISRASDSPLEYELREEALKLGARFFYFGKTLDETTKESRGKIYGYAYRMR